MRKINPNKFRIATRSTSKDINRQIVLNLIRLHQPVSRAELARLMDTNRANVTFWVSRLIEDDIICEEVTGSYLRRGRKPKYLFLNSQASSAVIAVDIRATRTFIMLTDSLGNQLRGIDSISTELNPENFVRILCEKIKGIIGHDQKFLSCQGIGVVVPGIVNAEKGTVLNAPTLGWKNVNLQEYLEKEFPYIPIYIENSGRACALAQMWSNEKNAVFSDDLVFVSISDGIGVGIIINGELVRGSHHTAGEYAHLPISFEGPVCSCGATGCWEAYISNLAIISQYNCENRNDFSISCAGFTVTELIARAYTGDERALLTLHKTGKFLGVGLAMIVNSLDPTAVFLGGEITEAWAIIKEDVGKALAQRVVRKEIQDIIIKIVPATEYPRLRGAGFLVIAQQFAAPQIA